MQAAPLALKDHLHIIEGCCKSLQLLSAPTEHLSHCPHFWDQNPKLLSTVSVRSLQTHTYGHDIDTRAVCICMYIGEYIRRGFLPGGVDQESTQIILSLSVLSSAQSFIICVVHEEGTPIIRGSMDSGFGSQADSI